MIGGSSGIGLGIAKAVARRGCQGLIAGRTQERLEAARRELGPAAETYRLDATDEPATQAFFQGLGPLDHLVATAAAGLPFGPFSQLDPVAFRRGFEGKFWAFIPPRAMRSPLCARMARSPS